MSAPESKLLASLSELKRRKVFRTGVGYAIAAFAVLQALSSVSDAIDLAPGTFRLIIIGILAGFPLTLFLAWAYDLGPGGVTRTGESTERGSPRWLELTIIGVLTVVVGGIGYAIYRPDTGGSALPRAAVADRSIAVLPFVNLSGDASNEYFGDGLAEELLNVLAKVPDLRVAARTSSFAYKGRNEDVRRIGNELNVATVLEGSVRKSGDKVRVTVQLINVADGYHLWSQNYDRTMSDIFTIQDEIAAAIADALKVTLLGGTASAASAGTRDVSAYDLYLLGRHNMQSRTESGLQAAIGYFDNALEVDPKFARAWSGKADAYNLLVGYGNLTRGQALPKSEQAALRALELDPRLAEAHASLGLIRMNQGRYDDAKTEFDKAIELDPDYAPAHVWYGTLLGNMAPGSELAGKPELAVQQRAARIAEYEKGVALDPQLQPAVSNLAGMYAETGRLRDALPLVERLVRMQPANASLWQTKIGEGLIDIGATVDAIQTLQRALEADPWNVDAVAQTSRAYLQLGDLDRAQRWADHALAMDPGSPRTVEARATLAVAKRDWTAALAAFAPAFAGRDAGQVDAQMLCMRLAVALVLGRPEAKTYFADLEKAQREFHADEGSVRFGAWIALAQRQFKQGAAAEATLTATLKFIEARSAEGYQRGDWHYAAAQAHALAGRRAEAAAQLKLALQRGWNGGWFARVDPTLALLREDPSFGALLSTLDANAAAAREALTRAPPRDWTPPARPATVALTTTELDGLVGNYVVGERNELNTIERAGDGLTIRSGTEPAQALRAIGTDEFMVDGTSDRLRFARGADGKATHAQLRWLGGEQRLKRIAWVMPVAGSADPRKFKDYVGRYRYASLGFELVVALKDGGLTVSQDGQGTLPLVPERDEVFFIKGQALRLAFVRDATGRVAALKAEQIDSEIEGARVE